MKILAILLGLMTIAHCQAQQQIITQWNFNSPTPDGSLNTGSLEPNIGSGFIDGCGGTELSFSTAGSNGGSGDESPDNSGLNTSHYPGQSKADKTAGIYFEAPLTGYKNIHISMDIRLTASASKNYLLFLSIDSGTTWTPIHHFTTNQAANEWFNNYSVDLSSISGIVDCPLAKFKFVSTFDTTINKYKALGASSNYSSAGSVRFDRLTISGEFSDLFRDLKPPTILSVTPINKDLIEIRCSEVIDETSISNCFISGTTSSFLRKALQSDSGIFAFQLKFPSGFEQGKHLNFQFSGLADTAGNVMTDTLSFTVFLNASKPKLVISEIMYNNPEEDDYEYLEIYNSGAEAAILEQFYLKGIEYTFPEMSIAPDSYLLLARDSILCHDRFNATFYEWHSGSLNNSGECLGIFNQTGELIDEVCFDNTGMWTKEPNGKGPSLELRDPEDDNAEPENWRPGFVIADQVSGNHFLGSPGFGFQESKVSFKSGEFNFTEGSGNIRIPLSVKFIDPNPIWVKVILSENNNPDLILHSEIVKISKPQNNFIDLEIIDDLSYENEEGYVLQLSEICNGIISGFTETTITIQDNDHNTPKLCISEWMPQNSKTVKDEFGEFEPWLELYNSEPGSINLIDYIVSVTDLNTQIIYSDTLDSLVIPALGFLVLYADSQPEQGTNHINLTLPKKSGRIDLIARGSKIKVAQREYETSYSNKSLGGTEPCSDSVVVVSVPSPGNNSAHSNSISELSEKNFLVHPNPTQGCCIYLNFTGDYEILNLQGSVISSHSGVKAINIEHLNKGIYLIRSSTGKSGRIMVP